MNERYQGQGFDSTRRNIPATPDRSPKVSKKEALLALMNSNPNLVADMNHLGNVAQEISEENIRVVPGHPGQGWKAVSRLGKEGDIALLEQMRKKGRYSQKDLQQLKPTHIMYDPQDLVDQGREAVENRIRMTAKQLEGAQLQELADFLVNEKGTSKLETQQLYEMFQDMQSTKLKHELYDGYGPTGKRRMMDSFSQEAAKMDQELSEMTDSSQLEKVVKTLQQKWQQELRQEVGLDTKDIDQKVETLENLLTPEDRELLENLKPTFDEYVKGEDKSSLDKFVNDFRQLQRQMVRSRDDLDESAQVEAEEKIQELKQELEEYKDVDKDPGKKNPGVLPDAIDKHITPEDDPNKEKDATTPYFTVEAVDQQGKPVSGHFRTLSCTYFDASNKSWGSKANKSEYRQSALSGEKQRLTCLVEVEPTLKALPLPRGYAFDVSSLRLSDPAARAKIYRDSDGCFYIQTDRKCRFSIEFAKETQEFAQSTLPSDKEKLYTGQLQPKTEALLQSLRNTKLSPLEVAKIVRKFVVSNHFYPGDGEDLKLAQQVQAKLIHTSGDKYVQALDESEFLECKSANTLFIALMRELGFAARLELGYMEHDAKQGKVTITNDAGHAWAVVWDGNKWVRVDSTPSPKPENKKKKDKKDNTPSQQADDGGVDDPGDGDDGDEGEDGEEGDGEGDGDSGEGGQSGGKSKKSSKQKSGEAQDGEESEGGEDGEDGESGESEGSKSSSKQSGKSKPGKGGSQSGDSKSGESSGVEGRQQQKSDGSPKKSEQQSEASESNGEEGAEQSDDSSSLDQSGEESKDSKGKKPSGEKSETDPSDADGADADSDDGGDEDNLSDQYQPDDETQKELQDGEDVLDEAKKLAEKMQEQQNKIQESIEKSNFKDLEKLKNDLKNQKLSDDAKEALEKMMDNKKERLKDKIQDKLDDLKKDGFIDDKKAEELQKKLENDSLSGNDLDELANQVAQEAHLFDEYQVRRAEVMGAVETAYKYIMQFLPKKTDIKENNLKAARQGMIDKRKMMNPGYLMTNTFRNQLEIKESIEPMLIVSIMLDVSGSMADAITHNGPPGKGELRRIDVGINLNIFFNELFDKIGKTHGYDYVHFQNHVFSGGVKLVKGFEQKYSEQHLYQYESGQKPSTVKARLMRETTPQSSTDYEVALSESAKGISKLKQRLKRSDKYATLAYFIGDGGDSAIVGGYGGAKKLDSLKRLLRSPLASAGLGDTAKRAFMIGTAQMAKELSVIFGEENTTVGSSFDDVVNLFIQAFKMDAMQYFKGKIK